MTKTKSSLVYTKPVSLVMLFKCKKYIYKCVCSCVLYIVLFAKLISHWIPDNFVLIFSNTNP